ncbi:MAG TPA: ABC transporter ATP-binding protein [Alphaproteobacteria bacterium]
MIRVDSLNMTYGAGKNLHHAVRDVSFEVERGLFYTLLGPSGCGKTTTLRCIAGLERPDSGLIRIGDETVFSSFDGSWVPSARRHIGMVFQSYAIWPHYDVFENVAFPLRRIRPRISQADIAARVLRSLELVQLGSLERRPATDLSGGQQQRLALARALVFEPRVLLLDEPLSNLDAKLREEMRSELKHLTKRLGITTVFVTHEQVEALTMSDRIAVMNKGRIVQEGTAAEIYKAPADAFVADFIGKTNLIEGRVRETRRSGERFQSRVDSPIGDLLCWSRSNVAADEKVLVSVRPENIFMAADGTSSDHNLFSGRFSESVFIGNAMECTVQVGGQAIKVQIHPGQAREPNDQVTFQISIDDCQMLAGGSAA